MACLFLETPSKIQKKVPLLFEGLTWREFKAVEQLLDRPGYRLSFLDGVLEIVPVPSEAHEVVKERIAALLELYLLISHLLVQWPWKAKLAK